MHDAAFATWTVNSLAVLVGDSDRVAVAVNEDVADVEPVEHTRAWLFT